MTYPPQPNPYGSVPDPQQPQPGGAWPSDPNTGYYAQAPQPPDGTWPVDPGTGQYAQAPQQPSGQQPYPAQPYPRQPYPQPSGQQPYPYPYAQPPEFAGPLPSPNFGWAIAALILCWPFCIPSFLAASKVGAAIAIGDMAAANEASADAKQWGTVGVTVGVILLILGTLAVAALLDS